MSTIPTDSIVVSVVNLLAAFFAKPLGEEIIKWGKGIYEIIEKKIKEYPVANESLQDMEKTPNDSDTQAALRVQLRKLIQSDEVFRDELIEHLAQLRNEISDPKIIGQVFGDNAYFGKVTAGEIYTSDDSLNANVNVGENAKVEGNIHAVINYSPSTAKKRKTKPGRGSH